MVDTTAHFYLFTPEYLFIFLQFRCDSGVLWGLQSSSDRILYSKWGLI